MCVSVDNGSFSDQTQWNSGQGNTHYETSGKGANRDEDGHFQTTRDKRKYVKGYESSSIEKVQWVWITKLIQHCHHSWQIHQWKLVKERCSIVPRVLCWDQDNPVSDVWTRPSSGSTMHQTHMWVKHPWKRLTEEHRPTFVSFQYSVS